MFSKAITVALALLPAHALAQTSPCLNDQTYEYAGSKPRSCSNIRLKEARRQKLCQLDEVRTACPQTCGICCDDDPTFIFPLKKVPGAERDCAWITKNEKNVDIRRTNYCGIDYFLGDTTVRNMCPKACDFCQTEVVVATTIPTKAPIVGTGSPTISAAPQAEPTRPPSPMPSPFPTLRPTSEPSESPSDIPSLSPSDAPSKMPSTSPSDVPSTSPSDSPSDVPSASPSDVPSMQPSASPSDVPSTSPSDVPSTSPSDSPSDLPSTSPSESPSDKPSVSPSEQPSNNPTMSIKPSPIPTAAPTGTTPTMAPVPVPVTSAPTVTPECTDDASYTFTLVKQPSITQNCEWITKNDSKMATRKATYCTDPKIKYAGCPATCGGCDCADDATHTFTLTKQPSITQDCEWIIKNNAETRRANYCEAEGDKCPAACGYCS